jgi:hypothetical protein
MRVTVTANTTGVEVLFARVDQRLAGDLSQGPMARGFANAGTTYLVAMRERFIREGHGWKPLAPATRQERQRQGFAPAHPILRRLGFLYRGLIPGQPGNVFRNHANGIDVGYGGSFVHPGYPGKPGKARLVTIAKAHQHRIGPRQILVQPDHATLQRMRRALTLAMLETIQQDRMSRI